MQYEWIERLAPELALVLIFAGYTLRRDRDWQNFLREERKVQDAALSALSLTIRESLAALSKTIDGLAARFLAHDVLIKRALNQGENDDRSDTQ